MLLRYGLCTAHGLTAIMNLDNSSFTDTEKAYACCLTKKKKEVCVLLLCECACIFCVAFYVRYFVPAFCARGLSTNAWLAITVGSQDQIFENEPIPSAASHSALPVFTHLTPYEEK